MRIRYPVPFDPEGITHGIVPDVVDEIDPILTGLAKLPIALLSCAVKIFPAFKELDTVNGTSRYVPPQIFVAIFPVVREIPISIKLLYSGSVPSGKFKSRI